MLLQCLALIWHPSSIEFVFFFEHHVGVEPKIGVPQIIHFNRVFHYKPSILGYPYFWKHPCHLVNTWDRCREWGPTVPGGEFVFCFGNCLWRQVFSPCLIHLFEIAVQQVQQGGLRYISRFIISSFIVVIASHYKDPGVLFTNRFEGKLEEL